MQLLHTQAAARAAAEVEVAASCSRSWSHREQWKFRRQQGCSAVQCGNVRLPAGLNLAAAAPPHSSRTLKKTSSMVVFLLASNSAVNTRTYVNEKYREIRQIPLTKSHTTYTLFRRRRAWSSFDLCQTQLGGILFRHSAMSVHVINSEDSISKVFSQ